MNYFDEYVSAYDMQDPDINYKYYHSYRVMNNIKKLSYFLKLSQKDLELAKVIGILHDIGRFEQDKLYNSFKDDKLDHADYGVKVLKENNILDKTKIDASDYEVVYKAIQNHNKFELPKDLTERETLFAKLIRDADKLDILYALGKEELKILRQDHSPISKPLETSFFNNKPCNKQDVKNKNDGLVITFGYIYDINFLETYQIIYEKKYYDKIYSRIEAKDIFAPYIEYTNKYIKERID